MARPVRRVVTGHLPDGRSTALLDGPAPNVRQSQAGNASTLLWVTDESPADVSRAGDRAARHIGVPPTCRLAMVFVDADEPRQVLERKGQ